MRDRRDLIEMYSIWVKPEFLTTEAIASRCADEAIRFAKEYHKEQLILNDVSSSFKVDKLHVGINSISLKDSDGNEYVLDEGKVYRKVVIEKYVLVDEKL
jgi:hypothetical protein